MSTDELVKAYKRLSKRERENFIKQISVIDSEVVGYTITGQPLTEKQYIEEINKGLDDIKNGRVINEADLLEEMKTW